MESNENKLTQTKNTQIVTIYLALNHCISQLIYNIVIISKLQRRNDHRM